MRKLDPQLEFLADGGAELVQDSGIDSELERYGVRPQRKKKGAATAESNVEILVQFTGDTEDLEAAGMTVRTVAGDVVTGAIPLDRLPDLAEIAEVERVESSRAMYPELDLATADTNVDAVHTGPPGRRGAGVIVGIVDTGIDFTHPSFRRPDGTSRILSIWDQGLTKTTGEASPTAFGYGVEYSNVRINAALSMSNPFASVRHRDPFAHGTHVAGIAAGDGSAAGQGRPGSTFVGVAPEADLIVVANRSNGAEGLGTSANTLDAVNYVFQRAAALGRPCVVNMSLGDNLGPHDGTSLLERGLDNLLGPQGRAFVKSAGNAAADGIHAQGTVATGGTVNVRFNQPSGDTSTNQIDLWYRGSDTFRISVVDPAGNVVGPVNVGTATTFTLPGGNTVRVDHRNVDSVNHDKRVFMTFARGSAGTLASGNWTLRLRSVSSPGGGQFDAWAQRGDIVPRFLAPHESPARTISTPGTAREIVTAASYITRGAGTGGISSFSSRGPTRDGRLAPTVAAPGQMIVSARAHFTDPDPDQDPYSSMGGTSMAAPHVAGVIALMLQRTPTLTAAQIRTRLADTARSDTFTGPVPNTAWGAGKLDASAAVGGALIGPIRSVVTSCPSVVIVCPSEPRVSCPTLSVPRLRCPVASIPSCAPSVLTRCISVPLRNCPSVLSTTCPVKVPTMPVRGPWRWLDPKVTLDPRITVDPRTTVDPRLAVDPTRLQHPRLGRLAGLAGRVRDMQEEAYAEGYLAALQEAGEGAGPEPEQEPEQGPHPEAWPPVAGQDQQREHHGEAFYDYDESWFDE